jgi:hypothetical protein
MAKANKTVETQAGVDEFLAAIKDATRRKNCSTIISLIAKETKYEPKMWGPSIVGCR